MTIVDEVLRFIPTQRKLAHIMGVKEQYVQQLKREGQFPTRHCGRVMEALRYAKDENGERCKITISDLNNDFNQSDWIYRRELK